MSCYPERRNGRLTGKWIAEALVQGKRVRSRFETRKEGEQWARRLIPSAPKVPWQTPGGERPIRRRFKTQREA
jgi:hypothetical protein